MVLAHSASPLAASDLARGQGPAQRVGTARPSALAIEAIAEPVTASSRLRHDSVPSRTSAPQSQHRLELAHAEQATRPEEGRVAEHEPETERHDLRRQRAAEPRVAQAPAPPPHHG